MKIAIIINGISRKKKFFYSSIYPSLQQQFNTEVFETQHTHHAIELSSNLTDRKYDYILAAGGDGTLNQVVNGLLRNRDSQMNLPAVGVIPLGTGNDFSKLCHLKPNADLIVRLLRLNQPKLTDIGKIICHDANGKEVTNYFINVCSMGMGPEVVKRLYKSNRSLGPTLTYLKAITATFFTHRPQLLIVKTDHWEWNGKIRVFAIANGKSFGNSNYIAPDAEPDDGIFSTFLAGDLLLLRFLFILQAIKRPKKIKDSLIQYKTITSVELNAPEPCAIEAEGEWMGWLPAKIEVLPKRIRFLR